jgi:hypothetical protein
LQWVALALPPTYVFEGMRSLLIEHIFRATDVAGAGTQCSVVRGWSVRIHAIAGRVKASRIAPPVGRMSRGE